MKAPPMTPESITALVFAIGDDVVYEGKTYRFPGKVCGLTDDGQVIVRATGAPNGDYAGMKHIYGPAQLKPAADALAFLAKPRDPVAYRYDFPGGRCSVDLGFEPLSDEQKQRGRVETPLFDRPAPDQEPDGMPGVETVADTLLETGIVIGASTWPDEQRADAIKLATAIRALFSEAFAAKEQQLARYRQHIAAQRARAEAAEARVKELEGAFARYIENVAEAESTDFIDKPGYNGPDEAILFRVSGRDENGKFTEESRALAAAIRAGEK